MNTWRRGVGVSAGQAEDVVDVRGKQAVAAVHVLAGVQVLVKPVHYGCHDLEGCLAQVH